MTLVRLLALCCLALSGFAAQAARVEIPLRIPHAAIAEALAGRLIYREGPCRLAALDKPKLQAMEGRLRLELQASCQSPLAWHGALHFILVPIVDSAGRLRMEVVDSGLQAPVGFIWDISKAYVHPRLQEFSYDFGALREALTGFLRTAGPPEYAAELQAALAGLEVLSPRVEASAVLVPIAFDITDAWLTPPRPAAAPAAPLTQAEVDVLDKALEPWDAFLAYTIKQLALDSEDRAIRKRLFTLLLHSRYELAAILSGEVRVAGDPVRALFIDAWNEMRAILADARYAVFLDAGDALVALDQAAPGLGVRVSADGLRQLARALRPGPGGDPLEYGWAEDPQLRRLFEVENLPSAEPSRPGTSWLDLFISRAHAADPALDRWVPTRAELPAYEARIGELLHRSSAAELRRGGLAEPYDAIFRTLLPATALIESCWRQYELRGGKVSYVRSAAGSVGIMQVNQRVWRGFYNVERLRWDTAYNMRAGAQILMRYVKDYAIPYAERTGEPEHVARAAYAVYNAGPRAVGRFAKNPPHPREQRVDERLWTLFRGIAAGGQPDLRSCSVAAATAAR